MQVEETYNREKESEAPDFVKPKHLECPKMENKGLTPG